VVAVDHVAGHEHQSQRGQELQQADQAEIPGRAGQVVHLPAHRHHQHLARAGARQPGPPEAQEIALRPQGGRDHEGRAGSRRRWRLR